MNRDPAAVPDRRRLHDLGVALVVNANAALRTVQLHAAGNAALLRPIEGLRAAVNGLLDLQGSAEVAVVDGTFFVNRYRLRPPPAFRTIFEQFGGELQRRGIGGITFVAPPDAATLHRFLESLLALARADGGTAAAPGSGDAPAGGPCSAAMAALRERGVEGIRLLGPMRAISEDETPGDGFAMGDVARARVAVAYTMALQAAGGRMERAEQEGGSPQGGRVLSRRVVQQFVDLSRSDPGVFLQLAALRAAGSEEASHAIAVAVLAISLGRRLGLDRLLLADLGLAALHHDAGRAHGAAPGGEDDGDHTALALKALLRARRVDASLVRRVLVGFEHHLGWDLGGHPPLRFKRNLHPFSAIIRIVNDFDNLTAGRPGREALSPEEALSRMRAEVGQAYHPELFETFTDMLSSLPGWGTDQVPAHLATTETLLERTRPVPGEGAEPGPTGRDATGGGTVGRRPPEAALPAGEGEGHRGILGAIRLKRVAVRVRKLPAP